MLNVRRLYLFVAAFVGLLLFMQGGSELLRLVFLIISPDADLGVGSDWWRERLSLNLALVAVGAPLWVGHWIWAQRLARDRAEEGSALRALYFLGALGVTIVYAAGAAGEILVDLLERLADGTNETLASPDNLANLIIYGLVWFYHIRQRPPTHLQTGAAATIARWYWYVVSFGSLGIVVSSLVFVIATLLKRLVGADPVSVGWWQLPVAEGVAYIIVSSIVWTYHWAAVQRQVVNAQSPELRSTLRKVYLYAMVGSGAAGALLASGRILYLVLLSVLGVVEDRLEFIDNAAWVVPTALVAATGWYYHRYHLQRDAALVAELPRQASIRRIYAYILTTIGISLLAFGAYGMLRLVIGILTGQADTVDLPEHYLQRQLSLYVTLLLVGLAAWVWYWRQIQRQVASDSSGEERRSLVRRIYLYLVSSASVIAVVVAIGTLLYEALRSILDVSSVNDFRDAMSVHVSVALIAVTLLAYHVPFLRREHRPLLGRKEKPAPEEASSTVGGAAAAAEGGSLVVTITGGDLEQARQLIQHSTLPEGTRLTFTESALSPDEVHQRLQAQTDDKE